MVPGQIELIQYPYGHRHPTATWLLAPAAHRSPTPLRVRGEARLASAPLRMRGPTRLQPPHAVATAALRRRWRLPVRGGGTSSGSAGTRAGAATPPLSPASLMDRLTPWACFRKEKLLDSLLGDQRRWCWGFLGAAVDEVLGRPGFILTRRRTVKRSVTRLGTHVSSGELLATKIMWSQGDVGLFIFYSKYKCPTTPMSCSILKKLWIVRILLIYITYIIGTH
jgi:hypothetical protein